MTNPSEPQLDDEDVAPTLGPTDATMRPASDPVEPDTTGHSADRREPLNDPREHGAGGGVWSRGTVFRREPRTRLELARSR